MADSPNFNPLSVATARAGNNYAPARPIQDVIQSRQLNSKRTPSKIEAGIRELYTHYLNHEKSAWSSIIGAAQLVALMKKGEHLIFRRPFGAPGYYVRPLRESDDNAMRQTAMNLMTFHAQVCEAKVIASNPFVIMGPSDDTPEAISSAQACRPVVDYYEGEWYTVPFARREANRYLTDGMVIHQVRWNPLLGGYSINEREVTREDVTLDEGGGECLDCDYEGGADSFQGQYVPQCPECGSPAVNVRQPITTQLARIGMGQSRPVGEPEIVSSSLMSWRWDLTKDLEHSSWAIKRQYIGPGAVKLMLGDVTIPDSQSSESYGLDVLYALAYAGQAFGGTSYATHYSDTSLINKKPTLAEFWISPEDQAMIETEGGETICGQTLPKGRLNQFFNNKPICVVGLNDMSLIVGMYANESHQDEVVTAQWFMDAESGVGRGLQDAASVQRRFNAVDGQLYQGMATTATPAVFIDPQLLREDQGRYAFTPGYNVEVNLALLPPGLGLKDAIYVGNPGQVSQQLTQYGSQFLMQMITMSALSVDFSENVLPVDNRTATGAQLTAQLANSLYGPMLAGKGQMRVDIAKKIVCLISKHNVTSRYYPGRDAARGRMVNGSELKHKVVFKLQPNSELPVNPFSEQADVRAMGESFGGLLGAAQLQQMFPRFFRAVTKPFNIKFDSDDEDDVSTLMLKRVESMRAGLMAGNDDPAELVKQVFPPLSAIEPKISEKTTWCEDWFDLEQGQNAPQPLRDAVIGLYWALNNLSTQKQLPQAMNQGLVQAAQMAPAAIGSAALQPQESSPPEQDDSAKIEAERDTEREKRQTELATKEMESKTQLATTKMQTDTQKEVAEISGRNQIRAAKLRPKPTVKKTA